MAQSKRQEYFIIRALIKRDGSRGAVHHLIATGNKINNTYNEDGEEIELSAAEYKKQEVNYSSRKVTTKEGSPLSLSDDLIRFSIISDGKREIMKSDTFEDSSGVRYPIERIDRLGDRQGEIIYQLFCKLD